MAETYYNYLNAQPSYDIKFTITKPGFNLGFLSWTGIKIVISANTLEEAITKARVEISGLIPGATLHLTSAKTYEYDRKT